MKKTKRVLILSDLHCGSIFGLTPPEYQNSFREMQQIGWNFFIRNIKSLGKIDLCIINGDILDGPGKKDSRQHITTDIKEQINIAISALKYVNANKFVFIRGTCYHVTTDRENEDDVARSFSSEIYDHKKIDVNGCIMHCRHSTGKGSSIYGSITPLQSNSAVQILSDISSSNEIADIYIRSHIHEYNMIDREPFTVISTPALQFKGMAYGRKFNSFYSYGFVWLDIRDKKDFDVNKILLSETGGSYKKESILKI
jgi:predicted MPP superfamily phosphohydrolase